MLQARQACQTLLFFAPEEFQTSKLLNVLTTKYRKPVFTGQMIDRLKEILNELLSKWDCEVIDFNAEEDHVHLLLRYTPQTELPKFINNLKTVTSRYLRKEFPDRVNQFYHCHKRAKYTSL